MKESKRPEQAGAQGESLEQVEQRFGRWRESRKLGQRIPPALWAAAVEMAAKHGLHRVVHALHLDRENLKKRLEQAGGAVPSSKLDTQFVELFSASAPATAAVRECVVELDNGRGAKMRIELNGTAVASLSGLCNAFWSAA